MDRKTIARDTLALVERGRYTTHDGQDFDISQAVDAAVRGTRLFTPEALDGLLDGPGVRRASEAPRIEVTEETSQVAARRLATEGVDDVVMLNFASARNPGGGFLTGAKAQEEDLARCSALYPCLLTQPRYYDVNRATSSVLYTDHVIYSPRVPFFRVDETDLGAPYFPSVITAPAPNAGALRRRDTETEAELERVMRRRAGKVLAVAEAAGHATLLLGAWGCGAFRNDPVLVADTFATWLGSERFARSFERVVFAILDHSRDERIRGPFRARLG